MLLGIVLGVALTFAGFILFVGLLTWIAYARRPRQWEPYGEVRQRELKGSHPAPAQKRR